jgi:Ca-activated chloride channel homolog
MNDPDFDLSRLGKRQPPEPRRAAIDAAQRTALDAFDQAAKKNVRATQGSGVLVRLHRIATQTWSLTMHAKYLSGSALATLVIVPIAGIAAWQVMQDYPAMTTPQVETKVDASPAVSEPAKTELQTQLVPAEQKYRVDEGLMADSASKRKQELRATEPPANTKDLAKENLNFTAKSDTELGTLNSYPQETAEAGMGAKPAPGRVREEAPVSNALEQEGAAATVAPQAAPAQSMADAKPAFKPTMGLSAQIGGEADATLEQGQLRAPAPVDQAIVTEDRDKFPEFKSNTVVSTATQPVSTFSVDVDTSGYSSLRRALNQGVLPDRESVRIEELVNYFPYAYAGPEKAEEAFKANVTVTPSPWNKNNKLLHVGIKGYDLPVTEQKPANLVFLLDVSGSMDEPDKLPLLKSSFRLLVNKLKPTDTVAIVTYAGDAGIVLEPTKALDKTKILNAIDNLQPGGSTAGEAGINAAYQLAEQAFVKDGVNRIMLATDGDFNVGAASDEDLKKLVEEKRKSGVFLSVLGFGEGNYQDNLMQTLAQNGNGVAAYIDTLGEAEKVLVQEASASLFTIAKDVKIQVEFNPARVSEYRLIGYETRALASEDFNNDRVDAGDIGSGHTVTAIYEMTPVGAPGTNDPLRYETKGAEAGKPADASGEYAFVKLRYKLPTEATSRLVTQPVTNANAVADLTAAGEDVRFGIAVSAFGQKLRDEDATANFGWSDIEALAAGAKGTDAFGYRGEFLKVVRLAAGLEPR